MTRPLSYAHHRIPQVIAPRGWVRIRVDGHDTIVPPAEGRAIVGVQLWGACGVGPRRPLRARLRLVRHKPTGPDQTGIAELAVPRAGRTFAPVEPSDRPIDLTAYQRLKREGASMPSRFSRTHYGVVVVRR